MDSERDAALWRGHCSWDTARFSQSSGTVGPLSRLSVKNEGEWSGDYLAAGVDSLTMDLNNFGASDLFLRLLLVDFGPLGPVNAAVTTAAIFVPGGSGWQNAVFDLSEPGLTGLLGTVAGALSNVDELRIFHSPAPNFMPGQNVAITAALGVDNISSGRPSVPEPATAGLLIVGLAAIAVQRRGISRPRT